MATKTETVLRKFTIVRNLPSDSEEKPDALLFGSNEPISLETARTLLKNEAVLEFLPVNEKGERLPAMAYIHVKPQFGEFRVLVTSVAYYAHVLSDKYREDVVLFEDYPFEDTALPKGHTAGELRMLEYGKVLDSCNEMYRTVGCDGCPKPGLECVKLNVGYRPWQFRFPYNRKDKDATGMNDPGTISEKNAYIIKHELRGENLESITKKLLKTQIEGFSFVPPTKTKIDNTAKMNRPLRPPRDHRFTPAPEPAKEKSA